MSDSKNTALLEGQEFGSAILPAIKHAETQLTDDTQKLVWWAALFGYLGGCCAASLGPNALTAIQEMTHKTTSKVINEHSH